MSDSESSTRLDDIVRARALAASGRAEAIRVVVDASYSEIADDVGVTTKCVWLWLTGRTRPSGDRAVRFVRTMDRLEARLQGTAAAG